jgi:hypothetical protein
MKLRSELPFFLLISAAILVPLTTWLLGSTFLVDDWGQLIVNDKEYWPTVNDWKELWGYRPVSLIFLPLVIQFFGTSWFLFAGTQLALYLLTIFVYFWWLSPSTNRVSRTIGLVLAGAPAVASTLIFSPVNQLVATVAMFFAAIGHFALVKLTPNNRSRWGLIMATAAFTISLLTYEVALPLVAYSVLTKSLDLYSTAKDTPIWPIHIRWIYLTPALIAGTSAFVWQKLIAPVLLESSFSRLSGFKFESLLTVVHTVFISIPSNLLRIVFEYPLPLVLGSLVCFGILISMRTAEPRPATEAANHRKILLAAFISLLAGGIIFSMSGHAADHTGYINRGMSLLWLPLALLLGAIFASRRPIVLALAALLVASNSVWFFERVLESNSASDLRLKVVKQLIDSPPSNAVGKTVYVDVPCTLPGSKSGIEIFCTSWDLYGALDLGGLGFSGVITVWDPSFGDVALTMNLEEQATVLSFDDLGNLSRLGGQPPWPNGNPFGRSPGDREYFAQDCLDLYEALMLNQQKSKGPDLGACLIDPY